MRYDNCVKTMVFADYSLQLPRELFDSVYDKFDGHTWYIQNVLNRLYGYNRDMEKKPVLYAVEQIYGRMAEEYGILVMRINVHYNLI